MNVPNLQIKRRGGTWWIVGLELEHGDGMGPYETKAEAESDKRGVQRFYRTVATRRPRGTRKETLRNDEARN